MRLPQLGGRVLEMDGLWTRTRAGPVEMKVVRDENGVALGSFAGWGAVIDLAWQQGATAPVQLVSDGDRAIAAGIALVYGSKAPHQLCHFSASGGLREYRRNLGWDGWREARPAYGGLAAESPAAAMGWARRIMALTEGRAQYWCEKALTQGLRHLETGEGEYKTIRHRRTVGTAEPRVPATGKDGHGMVAPQPVGAAPKARPDQPNHLKRNATQPPPPVFAIPCFPRLIEHLSDFAKPRVPNLLYGPAT